jgi:hypothetical protein
VTAVAVTLLAAIGAAATAQEPPQLAVPTLPGAAIHLDGNLDEPAWQQAALIDGLTQHEPHPGEPTPFATRIRIFTDGVDIYVGYDCRDPEPDKIAIHSLQRDGNIFADDSVDFVLDTFGDRRTSYYFLVTAGGAQLDGLVDAAGNPSTDWDGAWSVVTRQTAEGWSAELQIPARTLHFRRGATEWGFNIARQIARKQMVLRWTGIPHDASFFDLRRAGSLTGLTGMHQGIGLAVTPFVVGEDSRERPASSQAEARTGLDLTYSPTPGLTGVLTYHTDFAETEVDARQVNLTRFPLFFPEKRAFFVEGANQFAFAYGLDADFIPFFTRRIGLLAGRQVPLEAGLKVLGHSGRWGIGALGVATREETGAPPTTTLSAGRLTYDVGQHLRLGTLITSGNPDGVRDNSLGSFDAVYRTSTFRGDKNLVASVWGARSDGDLPAGVRGDAQRDGWGAVVDYPNDRWQLSADVREFGDGLDPALGFLPRPGTRWYQLGTAFQPRPDPDGRFGWARQLFFENFDYLITDLQGRTQSWRVFLAPFNVVTNAGDHFELNVVPYFERLDAPFDLTEEVSIPPGGYPFLRYRAQAEASPTRGLRPALTVWWGEFYDGHLTQWLPSIGWSAKGGHLLLQLDAEVDDGQLPDGDVRARLYGARIVIAVSPTLVFSTFTQYDSTSDSLGSNNVLRWTIQPGRELFLVLNRGWEQRTARGFAPRDDQVSAKVRWTFWW